MSGEGSVGGTWIRTWKKRLGGRNGREGTSGEKRRGSRMREERKRKNGERMGGS